MKSNEKLYIILFIALLILAFFAVNNAISIKSLTYNNIDLPNNASVAGICKDGKILQGLSCDPKITCCK